LTEPNGSEHRRSLRRRTLKTGKISFSFAAGLDCIVRNISETGALLQLETSVGVPDKFDLIIKPDNIKRSCEVAWRSAKRIGVRFV